MKSDFQPPRIATRRRAGPGVPAGKVVADPVSTIDLAQTFCDYGQAAMDKKAYSHSLRPLVETDTASRDFAISRIRNRTFVLRARASNCSCARCALNATNCRWSWALATASCTMIPTKWTTSSTMPHGPDISASCRT